jgi:hypothetical protein
MIACIGYQFTLEMITTIADDLKTGTSPNIKAIMRDIDSATFQGLIQKIDNHSKGGLYKVIHLQFIL